MGYEAYSQWGSWCMGEDVGIRNWTGERLVQSFGLCHLLGRGGFERKRCLFSNQNPNTLDDSNVCVCVCVWFLSQDLSLPFRAMYLMVCISPLLMPISTCNTASSKPIPYHFPPNPFSFSLFEKITCCLGLADTN